MKLTKHMFLKHKIKMSFVLLIVASTSLYFLLQAKADPCVPTYATGTITYAGPSNGDFLYSYSGGWSVYSFDDLDLVWSPTMHSTMADIVAHLDESSSLVDIVLNGNDIEFTAKTAGSAGNSVSMFGPLAMNSGWSSTGTFPDWYLSGGTDCLVGSSDATLSATSTVKGVVVTSLGIPDATLASAVAGSATITGVEASDLALATSFVKTNLGATVNKVVKYASGASTDNFVTDTAYADEAITDQDFFIIKVTAEDGTTILYYKIIVTVECYATGTISYVEPFVGNTKMYFWTEDNMFENTATFGAISHLWNQGGGATMTSLINYINTLPEIATNISVDDDTNVITFTSKVAGLAGNSIPIYSGDLPSGWTTSTLPPNYLLSGGTDCLVSDPPVITVQPTPANQTVAKNSLVTFSAVIATGAEPLSYQWYKGAELILGATSAGYNIPSTQIGDSGIYKVVVSNSDGTATSDDCILTVSPGIDATLSLTSTVKGETLRSLGDAYEGFMWIESSPGGTVTITAAQAADTSNTGDFITSFIPTDSGATIQQVVKVESGGGFGGSFIMFDFSPRYNNEAIADGDIFYLKVLAEDGATILYYKIVVTVTSAKSGSKGKEEYTTINYPLPPPPPPPSSGTVRIIKDTVPNDYQDFSFMHNIPNYPSSFTLDDDRTLINPSILSNVKSFTIPTNGNFSITQTLVPGYTTSVFCVDPSGGTITSGSAVNISMSNAEIVVCKFTNTNQNILPLNINNFKITSFTGPHGNISPLGTKEISAKDNQSYIITPDEGYHIFNVLIDGVSIGAITSYTFSGITSNHTISAIFIVN